MSENQRLTRGQIAALLAHALGDAVARQAVDAAANALHLEGSEYGREDALRILEVVAKRPGVVGVTAQFAKSRLILWQGQGAALAR